MFCLSSLLLWIIYLLVQLQKWIRFCKNTYILLEKVSITVILAFSLETVRTILEVCREVDALSCVTWLNSQLLFLYTSTRSPGINHTYLIITWLLFSSQMFFFASSYTFFTKFKQGENRFKSRGTAEDRVVYRNQISRAFAVAGFLQRLSALGRIS